MKATRGAAHQDWEFDGKTITVHIPMTLYGSCSVKSFLSYCFLFQTT